MLHATLTSKRRVSLGLGNPGQRLDARPGLHTTADSWGYHSDDGRIFSISILENLDLGGPTYTFGDTIGLGVLPRRRCAFFTKNGRFLGISVWFFTFSSNADCNK
jgi:hypothetical protein